MNRSKRRAATNDTSGASTPAALFARGLADLQRGQLLEAQVCCRDALAIEPAHADTLYLLGLLAIEADHSDHAVGYGHLLYLKLSLTGNEGEFIRRYRLNEPAFPHTSTANQFFSEAQFEAYRSLGEYVGDKMFLPAIVGDDMAAPKADVVLEQWFAEIGKNMLDPLPDKTAPAAKESPPAAEHG
jgi:hypothetical protein